MHFMPQMMRQAMPVNQAQAHQFMQGQMVRQQVGPPMGFAHQPGT